MNEGKFEHSEINQTLPVGLRNLILILSALAVVIVAGIYLQPQIAARLSATTSGTGLAVSPVEEAERFTAEWYAWQKAGNEARATTTGLALFPVEEAERYSAEQYAPVRIDDGLAISPIEEAERFTSEWYQWRMR